MTRKDIGIRVQVGRSTVFGLRMAEIFDKNTFVLFPSAIWAALKGNEMNTYSISLVFGTFSVGFFIHKQKRKDEI